MAAARPRRRLGPWRIGLLAVAALLLLAVGLLVVKVTTPPAPFPIPPDLALAYPHEKFDSPDNAWQVYEQFYDLTRAAGRSIHMGDLDPTELDWQRFEPTAWSPRDVESARQWVAAYQPGLQVFREATRKPYFLEAQGDLATGMRHLGPAISLGKASVYEAELAFRDGDETRAVDALLPVFVAAAQVTQFGPLISRFTGAALESIALRCIWPHLNDGSIRRPESLQRLAEALAAQERDRFRLADMLRVEYGGFHRTLEQWATGKREMDWSESDNDALRKQVRIWLELHLFYPRPLRHIQEDYRARIAALGHGLAQAVQEETAARTAPARPARDVLTDELMSITSGHLAKEAMTNAERHAMMVAVAAARYRLAHGDLPQRAADLVPEFLLALPIDPFDGQPVRTRRDGDAFVIWCIGLDFTDGGGAVAIPRKDWMNPNDRTNPKQPGDMVWRLAGQKR